MARNVGGQPWVFDLAKQGEGYGSRDSWLRLGTFTSATTEITTMVGHGLATGDHIRVEEGNSDLPSGLVEDTDYWVYKLSATTFRICLTHALAIAGTAITIADVGTTPNYILAKPTFPVKIWVRTILIDAGSTGGTFAVHDKISGIPLTGTLSLAANTHEQVVLNRRVSGIYITTIADGQILVYHGKGE